jgi:hypothetical protein
VLCRNQFLSRLSEIISVARPHLRC